MSVKIIQFKLHFKQIYGLGFRRVFGEVEMNKHDTIQGVSTISIYIFRNFENMACRANKKGSTRLFQPRYSKDFLFDIKATFLYGEVYKLVEVFLYIRINFNFLWQKDYKVCENLEDNQLDVTNSSGVSNKVLMNFFHVY